MFWSRFFTTPAPPSAAEAARVLAAQAARKRAADAIPYAEKRARIAAELRRSGAKSPIRPREEVVASVRADRALRKEKKHA